MNETFVKLIEKLTLPLEGQYPRPWTCKFKNPAEAKGFIMGFNQARSYSPDRLSHAEFLDYHLGRKGTSYDLYNKMNSEPSLTRQNIARLAEDLGGPILETDVYCFSSSKASTLGSEGKRRGRELSHTVIAALQPKFIVIFGANSKSSFMTEIQKSRAILGQKSEPLPDAGTARIEATWLTLSAKDLQPELTGEFKTLVIFIPSLGLPEWNKWKAGYSTVVSHLKALLNKHSLL